MEWLRCNKCFALERRSERNIFMTQCGHVFCDLCLSQASAKCHVCGTLEFRTMPLTKPPKLETMVNYFSSAQDFTKLITKGMNFHDEQLAISLRGFQQQGIKYERAKRSCVKVKKDIKVLSDYYEKMQEESTQLDIALRAYEQQESMEHRDVPVGMEMDVCETPQSNHGSSNGREYQPESSQPRNVSTRYLDTYGQQGRPRSGSSARLNWKSSLNTIPEYSYNPSPAFSNTSYQSVASTCDSGRDSMSIGTPEVITRQGDFLVPTTQRAPRSATSTRTRPRTLPRVSFFKTATDL